VQRPQAAEDAEREMLPAEEMNSVGGRRRGGSTHARRRRAAQRASVLLCAAVQLQQRRPWAHATSSRGEACRCGRHRCSLLVASITAKRRSTCGAHAHVHQHQHAREAAARDVQKTTDITYSQRIRFSIEARGLRDGSVRVTTGCGCARKSMTRGAKQLRAVCTLTAATASGSSGGAAQLRTETSALQLPRAPPPAGRRATPRS
jgi:hypothetical protein